MQLHCEPILRVMDAKQPALVCRAQEISEVQGRLMPLEYCNEGVNGKYEACSFVLLEYNISIKEYISIVFGQFTFF